MIRRYELQSRALRSAVLEGGAHTEPALRAAVEARAAALGGGATPASDDTIPSSLQEYVDTVARHAWKVTDDAVDAVRRAGWSEEAIFEITVCAAVGAASGRLQRAYAALSGES